ncbi:hypothetical protein CPter91_3346 [Collimonas pratensis]|uniref:Uncharacterized protein n=1 Tax=Collimonas pratensis TaxID=279113 RepID=A0A127Q7S4_9BURK|nr:hypothetical protein CPter91_3346 [Collimonas pratensis]
MPENCAQAGWSSCLIEGKTTCFIYENPQKRQPKRVSFA